MTRTEALAVADDVFEEFLPKTKKKERLEFLMMLFDELSEDGALDLEDDTSEDFRADEDEIIDL